MTLRTVNKKNDNRSKPGVFDSGVTVVSIYLLQAAMGLIVTIIPFYLINSFFASGILLREADPKLEIQASDNLVYHQSCTILFGFPMFLLLGAAPQSVGKTFLTLGIYIVLLIVMNVILLCKNVFKKKAK